MNDVEASVAELERAVRELGAVGVQIYTNVAGRPWDEPEFEPIFAKAAELDCTICVIRAATARSPTTRRRTARYEIWWTFGWPYETSAFMARIVFSGVFDRYPDLRFLTHHGGAMIPHFAGRIGPGWDQLGARTPDEDRHLVETPLQGRPLDYFEKFYADTCMMDAAHAIRCCLEFFGVDHSCSPRTRRSTPRKARTTSARRSRTSTSSACLARTRQRSTRRTPGGSSGWTDRRLFCDDDAPPSGSLVEGAPAVDPDVLAGDEVGASPDQEQERPTMSSGVLLAGQDRWAARAGAMSADGCHSHGRTRCSRASAC